MDEKFYIPENVYVIGTMNDIDRSVDTFDFAMRRRFRFIELKAEEQKSIFDDLPEDKRAEAISRMERLNKEISNTDELNAYYHIGPAYFLKLKGENLGFDGLWRDHIEPLLRDYVRGMYDEEAILERFYKAYENSGASDDNVSG